jgi:hypothetical protein
MAVCFIQRLVGYADEPRGRPTNFAAVPLMWLMAQKNGPPPQ